MYICIYTYIYIYIYLYLYLEVTHDIHSGHMLQKYNDHDPNIHVQSKKQIIYPQG